jgi:hypothetical protein
VLRPEQRRQLPWETLAEDFIGGSEIGVDRRLIHHQTKSGIAQNFRGIGRANFEAEA